ncbi:hypothetical protein HYZ70_03975 [Candidatus Curtissbacteria bacterium]|nr:hypothetical protein [Candidatus Curtissbacteria bacterium]
MSLIESNPTIVPRIKEMPGRIVRRTKELLRLDDDAPDEQEAALRLQVVVKIMTDIVAGGFFTQRRKNADRRRYHLILKGSDNKQYWVNLDYYFRGEDELGEHEDGASLAIGDSRITSKDQRIFGTHFSDLNSKFPDIVKKFNESRGTHMYKSPHKNTGHWMMGTWKEDPMPRFRRSERKKFLQDLLASHIDQEATEAEYDSIRKATRRHRLYWMHDTAEGLPFSNTLPQLHPGQ